MPKPLLHDTKIYRTNFLLVNAQNIKTLLYHFGCFTMNFTSLKGGYRELFHGEHCFGCYTMIFTSLKGVSVNGLRVKGAYSSE